MELVRQKRAHFAADSKHGEAVKRAHAKNDKISKEQKKHLRRIIKLHRIHRIAKENQDEQFQKQVARLTVKENSRHERRMKQLAGEAKGGSK
jgi:hypothetical protein